MHGKYLRSWLAVVIGCVVVAAGSTAVFGQPGQPGRQRDPLGFLKRALTEANAPALTADQETSLTELIKSFRASNQQGPDTQLGDAHKAYDAAIAAGDVATAQAQATIIANLTAAQVAANLQARARFMVDVISILKGGGQYSALQQKFGDHVIGVIGGLAGGPGFGPGRGPGRGPGGPGFGPGDGRMGGRPN